MKLVYLLLHFSMFLKLFVILVCCMAATLASKPSVEEFLGQGDHTNNWAVIVDTSRFWFNYRHEANALSIYRSVKRLGIPDSHIILMLADDMACDPRNSRPAAIFNNARQTIDVYGSDVEVDYRGYEVTAENFVRVLTGRLAHETPRSKRLLSDDSSNVLLYMTGHGGNGFIKFQDSEEISSDELVDVFEQMRRKKRYKELLFMVDTCQAESLFLPAYSPGLAAVGSSRVGEDSLSHHTDPSIGVYVIDRFTYYLLEFMEKVRPAPATSSALASSSGQRQLSGPTLQDMFNACPAHLCISHVTTRTDLYTRDPRQVPVLDFFGASHRVVLTEKPAKNMALKKQPLEPHNTSSTGSTKKPQDQQRAVYVRQPSFLPADAFIAGATDAYTF